MKFKAKNVSGMRLRHPAGGTLVNPGMEVDMDIPQALADRWTELGLYTFKKGAPRKKTAAKPADDVEMVIGGSGSIMKAPGA